MNHTNVAVSKWFCNANDLLQFQLSFHDSRCSIPFMGIDFAVTNILSEPHFFRIKCRSLEEHVQSICNNFRP